MSLEKMVKQMVETMNMPKGTEPYDTTAEVVRVDGDTVWVHIAGGVDETPVKKTINAVKGDRVQIRVGGGTAWIVGNETKPPTDDRVANVAQKTAENADLKAILAKKTADEASKVATNYIDFTEEEGLTVGHKNLESKVNISGGGVKLYDENGKVGTEIKSGEVIVGTDETNQITLNEDGIVLSSVDNAKTFEAGVIGTPEIIHESEKFPKERGLPCKLPMTPDSGSEITVMGYNYTTPLTFTQGVAETKTDENGHIITYDGDRTFTTNATSYYYHRITIYYTVTTYPPYLTFGSRDKEAEIGAFSATFGKGLIASKEQVVFGEYNIEDTNGDYIMIVGNGIPQVKANILALGRDYTLRLSGDAYVGCNYNSTGGRKLVSASTTTGSGTKSNMASSTNFSNLAELTLPDKGVYILVGLARFASNANGRRGLCWGVSATGSYDHSLIVVPPVTGAITRIQSVALATATSENYKVYLNCYHTAGTQLNVDYYWRYIKLA